MRSATHGTQVRSEVSEIYWNDVSGDWRLTHKDGMSSPRVGFSACFAGGKTHIMVSGGFTSIGDGKSNSIEVYNIAADKWAIA